MRKFLSLLLSLAMVLSLSVTTFAAEDDLLIAPAPTATQEMAGKTVILHSNDVHGNVEGYAYIAALKADYEAKGAEVILVDAGDYSQGTTYVSTTKGADAVAMMNAVGYDVVTLGNHEFDYGYAQLKENMKKAEFKVVCADVYENGKTIFDSNFVYTTASGVKVGFFGLETPEAQTKANPAKIKGLTFLDGKPLFKCAQDQIDALKKTADVVICLSHLGVDDESVGHQSYDLYANTTGIDMIIDGHSHTVMTEGKNDEPIQSTGTAFENVGVIVIDDLTKVIESNKLVAITEESAKDETVAAAAKVIVDRVNEEYGEVFAKSEVALNGAKAPQGNRDSETNNGDLITDAMLWTVLKDKGSLTVKDDHVVAITNGGGIRAAINPGDVTKKDINTVLPFGNTVAVVYITGAELLEALEASTYCTPTAVGGFPQVAGIDMTIDTTKDFDANAETYPASTYYGPASIKRVTINSINGKEFSLTDTYAVVTNDFCADGGDTYYAFAAATAKFDTGIPMDEAVMDYVKTELKGVIGEKYAEPQGRIKLIVNPFTDVKNTDWYATYVVSLYNDGIVNGMTDTTYDPAGTLTWAQALKLLLVANGDLAAADAKGPNWSVNTIATAAELGLVEETLDGTQPISRLEFCQVAAKLNKMAESTTVSTFTDCTDGYVMALVDAKVIDGMGDGTFAPDATLTRAQIAKIIYCLNAL